jgi:hypothetical protein
VLTAPVRPELFRYSRVAFQGRLMRPSPLRDPYLIKVALALFVIAIPFKAASLREIARFDFGLVPVYPGLLILTLAAAYFWLEKKLKLHFPKPLRYLAGFALLVVLSILQSALVPPQVATLSDRRVWWFSITQSAYVLAAALSLILLFHVFVSYPDMVWTAMRVHFAISIFVCCWGLFQFVSYYRGWYYPLFFNNNPHYAQLYMEMLGSFKRVNSTATEPSMLAIYLLSILPVAFYSVTKQIRILSAGLDTLVLVLNTLVLLMTVSLTGFLGIVLIALVLARLGQVSKALGGALAVGILALVIVLLSSFSKDIDSYVRSAGVVERFYNISAGDDLSIQDRSQGVAMGLTMFLHSPIIGVGEGNSVFYYYWYSDRRISTLGLRPRISAVGPRVLAEHGLIGAFLLFGFVLFTWRCKSPPSAPRRIRFLQESLRVSFLVMFLVMITSMGEITHYEFWLVGAAALALSTCARRRAPTPAPIPAAVPAVSPAFRGKLARGGAASSTGRPERGL